MAFELKITANTLEELWASLAVFSQSPQALTNKSPDPGNRQMPVQDTADTADTADTKPKRGPGRPPGSGNKSKPGSTLPPAFIQSVMSGPEEAEAETEAEDPEDAGDTPADPATTDADDDETRAQITQELGRYWKKSSDMKQTIQAFRAELGISTMLDLSPNDFPKAKALIAKLEAAQA